MLDATRRSAVKWASAVAAVLVLTLAGVAHSETSPRTCSTRHLHLWVTHTDAGLGSVGGYLAFTNRGRTTCTLSGWPRLTAFRKGASTTAVHVRMTQYGPFLSRAERSIRGVPVVQLRRGQTAVAAFAVADHDAGPTGACPPPYRQLRVTPPGITTSAVIPAWSIASLGQRMPSCSHIDVTMVVPASDIPPRGH